VLQLSPPGLEAFCRSCGSPLHLLPDTYPLIFLCDREHLHAWVDLFKDDLPGGGPPPMLKIWEQEVRLLHKLSSSALHHGRTFVAADFKEAADRIEGWISSFQSLLSRIGKSPSLPD